MKINIKYKSLNIKQQQYNLAIFVSENIDLKMLKNAFFNNKILVTNDLIKIVNQLNLKKNIYDLNLDINKKIIFIKVKKNYIHSYF